MSKNPRRFAEPVRLIVSVEAEVVVATATGPSLSGWPSSESWRVASLMISCHHKKGPGGV